MLRNHEHRFRRFDNSCADCGVPNAFRHIGESNHGESPVREGAFVVARGRLAQEEATGSKLFVDNVTILGGRASQLSALAVAIQEQEPDQWSAMGA